MGDRGIAIARQVDQEAQLFAGCEGIGQAEHVDQPRAAGRLARKRQAPLVTYSTLMAEDLPALERPTKQTSGAAGGNWSRRAAEM